jgi:hypothetical protein
MMPIRLKSSKRTKYRNERVEFDGLKFDSKREAARWGELRMLEKLGQISMLRRQVAYELVPAVKFAGARARKPAIRLIADFEYVERGVKVVEDVKSPVTAKVPAFQMKRHLMLAVHAIDVRIVT